MEQKPEDSSSGHSADLSSIRSAAIPGKVVGSSAWDIPHATDAHHFLADASLFSSSLPVLPQQNLNFTDSEHSSQSLDKSSQSFNRLDQGNESQDHLNGVIRRAIGGLLSDDEELLADVTDDFDLSALPSQLEDLEDDLFDSGGGLEMDSDPQWSLSTGVSNMNISSGFPTTGNGPYAIPSGAGAVPGESYAVPSGVGTVSGQHPLGEHPSRTLFVRNVNSNVEDSELREMFKQFGDIRTLYTACKHRGFVMISYFDIRAARTAMRVLQNKPLRRRKLDIHFSIPKDNPSEKDMNQGTLVIFNLDPSVSNDELLHIFGAYGEVKEIRETPHKRHHKFIEFYDVRAAEAALKALNRSEIAGKRIKLEPSRPGGARRNLLQHPSQDLEQDETRTVRHLVGSPVTNSPPGSRIHIGSPISHNSVHAFSKLPALASASPVQSPVRSSHMSSLASSFPSHVSDSVKMALISEDQRGSSIMNQVYANTGSAQGFAYRQSPSFPEVNVGASPGQVSYGEQESSLLGVGRLSGPQYLWGSRQYSGFSGTSPSPTSPVPPSFTSSGQSLGLSHPSRHGSFSGSQYHHQPVGSAPSAVPFDAHFGFLPESPETSFLNPVAFGGTAMGHNGGNYLMNIPSRATLGSAVNIPENVTPSYRTMSLPMHGLVFPGNGSYHGPGLVVNETFAERGRSGPVDGVTVQTNFQKQYELDIDKIARGEDTRTTLMIKNIPNKYTSKMLLAAIDESHRGLYDFLYLPIDFKNKCNVGYAFINLLSPYSVVSFYKIFYGKKWERFNSEKVASLAYARIQGKAALVAHFQNSSLMTEDRWCRPIVFHYEGEEEDLRSTNLNVCIRQPGGSYLRDPLESPKRGVDEKSAK